MFEHLNITEQEYVHSYRKHSETPEFKAALDSKDTQVEKEVYPEDVPEELTREKAIEIKEYAQKETQRIMNELTRSGASPIELQQNIQFENVR